MPAGRQDHRTICGLLAEFTGDFELERLSEPARACLKTAILDTIAAGLAGTRSESFAAGRAAGARIFGPGSYSVWTQPGKTSLAGAIFANCTAASALDVDDGHRGASGHAGAAIVPAVLTFAQTRDFPGRRLLEAILVGYDVALRVGSARIGGPRVSYASGRWVGYGVAAALARLQGLGPRETAHAIAIAGAEAPMNLPQGDSKTSSTVKGSSPWASLTAYAAVERAGSGATGPVDLLDRAHAYDGDRIRQGLGQAFEIENLYFKPYASCRYTHPVLDAIAEIQGCGEFSSAGIQDVEIAIFPEARKLTNDVHPSTVEGAQFSIPFTAALALIHGVEALLPMQPGHLRDERVRSLSKTIDIHYSPEFAGCFPNGTPARVIIRTRQGVFQAVVHEPLGDPANPMDFAMVGTKLRHLTSDWLADAQCGALIDAVAELETRPSRDLLAALEAVRESEVVS